jgi:serine/threonine-protein kinase
MVARAFGCDEPRLRSFLDDRLPEDEHAELADHLEACADCRRALERLAAGSRFWGELRQLSERKGAPGSRSEDQTAEYGKPAFEEPRPELTQALAFLEPADAPGSLGRLSSYDVTEVVGRGGFGLVLKAFDPALGRAVAIKVLAPELGSSAAARSRFAREARAAAAVVHEHVVAIHAVDSWKGLPYLVMPYVAGVSLQERVDGEGPLGVKEVLRIGMQTAQGLAAAHAQGLVHRDVKPSNILLENGVERVKLTDFGLARAIDDASLTQSGVVAGTPQYMSPEQAQGEPVDHRSDLFSLGSVLYFACTGRPPFRASSTPAVLRRVCDEKPRPLREVNADVPVWLAQIIERLHEKDRTLRFQTADEIAALLARQLGNLQRGLPIELELPIAAKASPVRRRLGPKTIAAMLVATVAALLVLASSVTVQQGGASGARAAASTPAQAGLLTVQNGRNITITTSGDGPTRPMIKGSGVAASKTWDISGFDSIQIGSTFHARIARGASFKVTTSADDNILEHIRVIKIDRTLQVGLESGSYSLKTPLTAEITLPTIARLDLSGASKTTLNGFDSERDTEIKVSGASQLSGMIKTAKAEIAVDGASIALLSGSAAAGRLVANGSSHLKLGEFRLKQCEVDLDGASTAQIEVHSEFPFKANVSGSSHLKGLVKAADIHLDLDGASHATLEGSSKDAEIRANGVSQVEMIGFAVNGSRLHVKLDGVSSLKLSGRADRALVEASSGSRLDLSGFVAQEADVTLDGSSQATIDVRGKLTYDLSSVSRLNYRGNPTSVTGKKSGASTISGR